MDAAIKKQKHPDRITLAPSALEKLSQWTGQLNSKNPGVTATRSDLVAWLIAIHADELSSSELNLLEEKFFDSVKYAKWAVKAVIEAKARGEVLNFKLIGKDAKPPYASAAKAISKKEKKPKVKTGDSSTIEDQNSSLFQSENDKEKDGSAWPDGK
jgi:hypothetical protein